MSELLSFRAKTGTFITNVEDLCGPEHSPSVIWNGCFGRTKLCLLASKVLSLPATSVECERNFSIRGFIHSKVTVDIYSFFSLILLYLNTKYTLHLFYRPEIG